MKNVVNVFLGKSVTALIAALSVIQLLGSCAAGTARRVILPDTLDAAENADTVTPLTESPFAFDPEEYTYSPTLPAESTEKPAETSKKPPETTKKDNTTTTQPEVIDDEDVENRPEEDAEEYEEPAEYVEFDYNFVEIGKYSEERQFRDVPLPAFKQIYVYEMADEFGVPAELIFGVMKVETGYRETLKSKNGRYIGIMQISLINMDFLYKKFGTTDLQDFCQNVQAGAYFLSKAYKKYNGDVDRTLMCYHMGEGGAKRRWAAGVYTDGYCNNVKKEMARIIAAGYLDAAPVT